MPAGSLKLREGLQEVDLTSRSEFCPHPTLLSRKKKSQEGREGWHVRACTTGL